MKKDLIKRVFMVCVGVFLLSYAVSLSVYANLGTDPATCLNLGISGKVHLSFGVWQLIFNCIVLVFTFIFSRHLIGIGTVINMVTIGFLVDFFNANCFWMFPAHPNELLRIVIMAIGVVLISFGAALYIYPQLGVSPYDSVAFFLAERFHFQFRWCRIIWDVSAVLVGWLCGSVVGVGTVVTAFCIGPLIKAFGDVLAKKFPFDFDSY